MTVTVREFNKRVRDICDKAGWGIYSTYNDKRKDNTIRRSFARTNWPVPQKMKDKIISNVKQYAEQVNFPVRDVRFIKSTGPCSGTYDKLVVVCDEVG